MSDIWKYAGWSLALVVLTVSHVGCGNGEECAAVPSCESGDERVESCPQGAECYEETTCGRTITCRRISQSCDALPECDSGDREVESCPDAASCYTEEACGLTITCVPESGGDVGMPDAEVDAGELDATGGSDGDAEADVEAGS